MTVASQLSTAQCAAGGQSVVVLAKDRELRIEDAGDLYVDYTRNCPRTYFNRRELAVNLLMGTLGARRPYFGRMWLPAIEAIRDRAVDAVLVYDGHYAAPGLPWWNELVREPR